MLPRLQEMVLLKIYTLGPRCTIAQIQKSLSSEIGDEMAWNSVHTTVLRLIDQGNVDWEFDEQRPNRSRQTKLYSVTPRGGRELMNSVRTVRSLYGPLLTDPNGIDRLLQIPTRPARAEAHA